MKEAKTAACAIRTGTRAVFPTMCQEIDAGCYFRKSANMLRLEICHETRELKLNYIDERSHIPTVHECVQGTLCTCIPNQMRTPHRTVRSSAKRDVIVFP